jgi:predicted negative regulator of RcsB-dependent stress response
MAYYDLEEQEQLSELKAWWKQYGALCLGGLALALAAIAGYQGWLWYQERQSNAASAGYSALLKQAEKGERKAVDAAAKALVAEHPRTGYAALASLTAARLNFDAGDLASAKESLQWVVDHARDEDMKSLARIRLAGVLLDQKSFDDALKLLDAKSEDPMANLIADLRGDVFVAKGSTAEARAAYQAALEKTDARSPYRNLIQIKIDALGSAR